MKFNPEDDDVEHQLSIRMVGAICRCEHVVTAFEDDSKLTLIMLLYIV